MLDWIKDPVSAKDYARQRKAKGCGKPTDMWFPSGKFCKSISCINGEFGPVKGVLADNTKRRTSKPAGSTALSAPWLICASFQSTIHAMREASVLLGPLPSGNWSDVACTCTCVAEFLDNQPGKSKVIRADVHVRLCQTEAVHSPVQEKGFPVGLGPLRIYVCSCLSHRP